MFDLLITYINFIILSVRFIVSFLAFRPPNPKGVRITEKKEKQEEIEILYSVPVKKENEKKTENKPIKEGETDPSKSNQNNKNNNNKPQDTNKNIKRKLEYRPANNMYAEFELIYLENNNETNISIPAFIFKPKDYYQYRCLIIYCHGNSGDIGTSFLECQFLSRNLRCDVLSFEYPGYGLSKDINNTNEKRSYIYIRKAYKYAREKLNYQPKNIIIYGFSLGTGLAFDLACDKDYPNAGVILQSPFLSITRTFYNFKKTYYFDIFNSCDKAKFCKSKIYIIHGNKDTIVPYIHGRILAKLLPKGHLYGFYTVQDANHNDLIKFAKEQLYYNISNFIYDMLFKTTSINEEITERDKESSISDISSRKSNGNFHVSEKSALQKSARKIELDNNNYNNISSKEKLKNEDRINTQENKENKENNDIENNNIKNIIKNRIENNIENNINKDKKDIKNEKDSQHELSCIFPKADDNDTFIDVTTKIDNDKDIKITVKEKQ